MCYEPKVPFLNPQTANLPMHIPSHLVGYILTWLPHDRYKQPLLNRANRNSYYKVYSERHRRLHTLTPRLGSYILSRSCEDALTYEWVALHGFLGLSSPHLDSNRDVNYISAAYKLGQAVAMMDTHPGNGLAAAFHYIEPGRSTGVLAPLITCLIVFPELDPLLQGVRPTNLYEHPTVPPEEAVSRIMFRCTGTSSIPWYLLQYPDLLRSCLTTRCYIIGSDDPDSPQISHQTLLESIDVILDYPQAHEILQWRGFSECWRYIADGVDPDYRDEYIWGVMSSGAYIGVEDCEEMLDLLKPIHPGDPRIGAAVCILMKSDERDTVTFLLENLSRVTPDLWREIAVCIIRSGCSPDIASAMEDIPLAEGVRPLDGPDPFTVDFYEEACHD